MRDPLEFLEKQTSGKQKYYEKNA